MSKSVQGVDELMQAAAAITAAENDDARARRARRLMQTVSARADAVERIFGSASDFHDYVVRRHDAQAVQARLEATVGRCTGYGTIVIERNYYPYKKLIAIEKLSDLANTIPTKKINVISGDFFKQKMD